MTVGEREAQVLHRGPASRNRGRERGGWYDALALMLHRDATPSTRVQQWSNTEAGSRVKAPVSSEWHRLY